MDLWCPQPYFVDKSQVIKVFLRSRHKVLMISAPQGFLKTTNMRMIASFVDGLSHPAQIERRKSLWHEMELRIMKDEGAVDAYFGQWPYLYVSFSLCGSQCTIQSMIEMIRDQYDRHEEMLAGDRLSPAQRATFRIYRNFGNGQLGVGERKIADALSMLCDMLYTYHRRQVFVFVDNYDFPLLEALAKEKPLSNVQPFLAKMVASLYDCKAVKKVLLNSISSFSGLPAPATAANHAHVKVYRFLDDHKFGKFYGFTEEDAIRLANTNRCSSEITKQVLAHPYLTAGAFAKIYSPEWLLDFLKRDSIDNPVWFEEILRKPAMTTVAVRRRLAPLEQGKCVKAKVSQPGSHSDLLQLNRLLNGSTADLEDEEVELVTRLLFELGTFTYVEHTHTGSLSCYCLGPESTKKLRVNDTSRMATHLKNLSLES